MASASSRIVESSRSGTGDKKSRIPRPISTVVNPAKRKNVRTRTANTQRPGTKKPRIPADRAISGDGNDRSRPDQSRQNVNGQVGEDDGDDSMDELLADLRPLRRVKNEDAMLVNGGDVSSMVGGVGDGRRDSIDMILVSSDNSDSEDYQAVRDNAGAAAPVSDRRFTFRSPRSLIPTATASPANRRFPHYFPPRVNDGTSRGNAVVITLSDSEDEDSRPFSRQPSSNANQTHNQASVESNTTSAPSIAADAEYARILQRQFDREFWHERLRRSNRQSDQMDHQNNSDDEVSETATELATSSNVTQRPPTPDPEAVNEGRASVVDQAGSSRSRRMGTILDSLAAPYFPTRPPRPIPFHRRPVPERNDAQGGRQSSSRSIELQPSASAANGEGSSNFNGTEYGSALIDIARMRRLWFHRALRYGDFEQLESALMDLAQALGEGLTDEQINRLPTGIFSLSDGLCSSASSMCTVCMEEFVDNDVQRHMPCLHTFHKDCIDVWLRQKSTCPICRVDARRETLP